MNNTLEVFPRKDIGKKYNKILRRSQKIPAIIYGGKAEAQSIIVDDKQFRKAVNSDNFLGCVIDVALEGKTQSVFVKNVERHPYKDLTFSIDFQRVTSKQKIKVRVPITPINEKKCEAIRLGAVLTMLIDNTWIRCLPKDLPKMLTVDVADLQVGSSIYLSDLKIPKDTELFNLLHNSTSYNQAVLRVLKSRKSQDLIDEDTSTTTEEPEDA